MRRTLAGLVALCAVSAASSAAAQMPAAPPLVLPALDTERFLPPFDDNGFIGIQGSAVPGHLVWNTVLTVHWSYRPVVGRSDTGTSLSLVENRLVADTALQVGITDRVAVALSGNVVLWQNGDTLPGYLPLPNVAAGDPRLSTRVRLLGESADAHRERREGPGLALQGTVWLPGLDERSLFGERALRMELDALADFHVLGFGFGAMLGARYRPEARELLGQQFNTDILGGLAVEVPIPVMRGFSGLAELRAATDSKYTFASATTVVEVDVGPRFRVADFTITGGVGFGLAPGVGSPVVRASVSAVLTPRVHDQDADGIPDDRDQCPPLAEDMDGFEDADGCPDPDNDNDLVPDPDDHCPLVAAEEGHDEDEDGCTDPDADHDGVPEPRDACPADPEDRDGFADDDGCPDPDNDGDGVLDAADQCPTVAEDRNGIYDDDGCPDATTDHDHDGVPDATDRCPEVPEDRDGHADDDGCPDPDDDRDGVLDAHDQCPTEPETVNGFRDDDGCPDTGGHAAWRVSQGSVLAGSLRFDVRGALPATEAGALDQLALLMRATGVSDVRLSAGAEARFSALRAALAERGVTLEGLSIAADPRLRGAACEVRPVVYQH